MKDVEYKKLFDLLLYPSALILYPDFLFWIFMFHVDKVEVLINGKGAL